MAEAQDTGWAPTRGWSLRRRLLITASVVLAGFLLLTGLALERAFTSSALAASRDRLQARIYLLMGATDLDATGQLQLPATLPEPALAEPASGAAAAIAAADGTPLWQSASTPAAGLDYPPAGAPGVPVAGETSVADEPWYTLSYPVIWELAPGRELTLQFRAAESRARVAAEVAAFRGTLQRWLGGAGVVLLLLQAVMLGWILRPLRRVAGELGAIEAGEREQLAADYPLELRALTDNLNGLLRGNQARLRRYRDALADLAHSLKTPLAVLRAASEGRPDDAQRAAIREQLDHMDATIGYQLQRAAASGRSPLSRPVPVAPEIERLLAALAKVYQARGLELRTDIAPGTVFTGDAGDFTEIAGNLLDNACKWARHTVSVTARNQPGPAGGPRLRLVVDDDGPGIAAGAREAVTRRGVRADSRVPGQGIGLAVVRELVVTVYGGELQIEQAPAGGARLSVLV